LYIVGRVAVDRGLPPFCGYKPCKAPAAIAAATKQNANRREPVLQVIHGGNAVGLNRELVNRFGESGEKIITLNQCEMMPA
jgi:hypothetical protein